MARASHIPTPNIADKFTLMDRIPVQQCTTTRDSEEAPYLGQWTDSPLSHAFFSDENVQIIQNGIRAGVYKRSNGRYIIAPQNDRSLHVIMRSVFLQHAVNQPTQIAVQIDALNKKVLEYCVGQVYEEAKGHMKYLYDSKRRMNPITHPTLATQKGLRQNSAHDWFGVHDNEHIRGNRNKPRLE